MNASVGFVLPDDPSVGRVMEVALTGLPGAANPFDPELIRVDGVVRGPSGRAIRMPAFWCRDFTRGLQNGREVLASSGSEGWRLRYTPLEAGEHWISLEVGLGGGAMSPEGDVNFVVGGAVDALGGFLRVNEGDRYFADVNGRAQVLVGHCVCWPGQGGTFDYDAWLEQMSRAGENFTRLWMCPWAFGMENPSEPLTQYRQDRAWQLDHVLTEAGKKGIQVLLCLDYHGMFESEPDYWGGNNWWPENPYNAANGGPCAEVNAFFTSTEAHAIYQKRLRYLVGRYAAYPNLLAWQFFNELDNVYRYLDPADVAAWHALMGDWLQAHDPYEHLTTTSFSGGDRPEVWSLTQMDFVVFHSYGQPDPALGFADRVGALWQAYRKPVMIGEFGVSWQGWNRPQNDPWLRGWRQGIWAGLAGGAAGTAMSWWWQDIHTEDLYGQYRVVRDWLADHPLGGEVWEPVVALRSTTPPERVGDPVPGGEPFTARLMPGSQWGVEPRGSVALVSPSSVQHASGMLNAFVHGTAHSDLRVPFRIRLWCGTGATCTLRVNSVSEGAVVEVLANRQRLFRQALPNLDGGYQVNGEYDTDLVVTLDAGYHTLDIVNSGSDWFYLDWVEVSGVLPSEYEGGWQPSPVATGMRREGRGLVYVAHPDLQYPAQSPLEFLQPLSDATLVLSNWPAGPQVATWSDPATGASLGETWAETIDGVLTLPLPVLREAAVGSVQREPLLQAIWDSADGLKLRVVDGGAFDLMTSMDLVRWEASVEAIAIAGETAWRVPVAATRRFYRARSR